MIASFSIFTLLFFSCFSVSFQTKKDSEYRGFLTKVAIVAETGNIKLYVQTETEDTVSRDKVLLRDYLSDTIENRLTKIGVKCKAFHISELELDEKQIQKEIDSYSPNQVLIMQLKEATVMEGTNDMVNGTFDVIIYDTEQEKNVWRAKMELKNRARYGAFTGFSQSTVDQVVDEMLKALKNDALIGEFEKT